MAFQAEVGTWVAAHILARLPIGGRFGINNEMMPVAIRLETGKGLDDIEVTQSDGGTVQLQCKTSATLGTSATAPLTKTIGQLARFMADAKAGEGLPDLTRTAAILAVRSSAPASLDQLEAGLRAFDMRGAWAATVAQRSQAERVALGAFERLATTAWTAHRGAAPLSGDLVDMARIFHLARFSMAEGGADWREASRLLGRRLFGDEAAGDAPLRNLKGIVRTLIGRGAAADRAGLLRALRLRGHEDVASPDFAGDIARLDAASERELARLRPHSVLTVEGGLTLARDPDAPLDAAIASGSLLVIGEPGAGKTGALVAAAERFRRNGDTVMFLSVDRFPGVGIASQLQSELSLDHPLIDVLAGYPGSGRKILMIDALDAARGGPAEAVFATLIEEARARLDDWIVVASIRTFDLRNGCRYRTAMAGAPPDPAYADKGLTAVRHFLVPRLAATDLDRLASASPTLAALFSAAPPALHALLHNIFNLSLAAQLLSDGARPDSFAGIRSQSGLIDAYEDERLATTALQQAAAATVGEMAGRGRLAVRKVVVQHGALDDVIQAGVLVEADDLVSFAHHVLFDHVAGRFYLEWDDDPARLITQVSGDSSKALLLAPALRFAIERLWRGDRPGRAASWAQLLAIFSADAIDPVVANVALRTAVENVETTADIEGLAALIAADPDAPGLATLLSRLSRFVSIEIETAGSVGADHARAWATLAAATIAPANRALSDATRILLHSLFDKADLGDASLLAIFGTAARRLLAFAWDSDPPMGMMATNAIRYVGRSFAADPAVSKIFLDRILREPHFSKYADKEATWLAEQIIPIARADPEFAAEIYAVLFTQAITDDGQSWFGGAPSRIMPLSSNRRQDYAHCRWTLGCAMAEFLTIAPAQATRALIAATLGKRMSDGFTLGEGVTVALPSAATFTLAERDYGIEAWDGPGEDRPSHDDDMLAHFVAYLRSATREQYAASVAAAATGLSSGSVWARLFGVGAERVADVGALLWPYAAHPEFLCHADTMRDAIRFVAAAYPSLDQPTREDFEAGVLAFDAFDDDYDRRHWQRVLGRLLKLIPEPLIATAAMRALRAELEASDALEDNDAERGFTITRRDHDHGAYYRKMLERDGVDLDKGPDGGVLEASDALDELVRHTSSDSEPPALATLWAETHKLLAALDMHGEALNERVSHPAWGHIANAADRVAEAPAYQPGEAGMPSLEDLMDLLDRLSSSPYPTVKDAG